MTPKKKKLVVIFGATATGKTDLSLHLAQKYPGEIISADSMQIYQGMDIGTATPAKEKRKEIPHHLLSILPPDTSFSVADFQREAQNCIQAIIQRKKIPYLVGGTGLYIKAVLEGFLFPPLQKDPDFRNQCQDIIAQEGREALHKRLQQLDEETAQKIHPHDERRMIRALEIIHLTQKTPTYYRREKENRPSPYQALKLGLTAPAQFLYSRIEDRVDDMMERGLIQEVQELLAQGYSRDLPSMQGLGYKEMIGYLEGEYSYQEALRRVKRNTRRFAKRQRTWFRKEEGVYWFSIHKMGQDDIYQEAGKRVEEFYSHSPTAPHILRGEDVTPWR